MKQFVTVMLACVAMASAAPGHGYYRHTAHGVTHGYQSHYQSPHGQGQRVAPATATRTAPGDVVDVAVGAGSFKTLVKIVSDLGLVDTLKNAEALTVFAPSDDAFAKLPAGTLESLTADQAKEIVLRHVVTAKVPAAAVTTGDVATIGGELIGLVKTPQGGVQINYKGGVSNVVTADVQASNGVIHVIDSVILPAPAPARSAPVGDVVDVAVGAGSFKTLVKIVSDLGLVDTLKNAEALTVFAPSDDAFAKLPAGTLESLTADQAKEIVLRHVVTAKVPAAAVTTGDVATIGGELIGLVKTPQGGVQINYKGGVSNVVTADVQASNGVIHVIDNVILPAPAPKAAAPVGDVVDVAVGAGSFTTLVKIVSDLGLVDTLKAAKEVTIFAPSDAAFAKLPAGTLESLTADQAKAIVLRHVVAAKVPASVVVSGNVRTFGNEMIELIKTAQGGVQIRYNGGVSNVVTADVNASNGIIHVIDKVIL